MNRLPTLFISHGSPMLAIQESSAHQFLSILAESIPKPKAIIIASAHWETNGSLVTLTAKNPQTIHDFSGFPRELFDMQYPAPGAPEIALHVKGMLEQKGLMVDTNPKRGLDHGAWVPLSLMYPKADIPVTQVSILRGASPAQHFRAGLALNKLRDEGVLVIGSGSITHNLYEFRGQAIDTSVPLWVSEFNQWMHDRLVEGDKQSILDYRKKAPHAEMNHPSEEHLAPLFVAMGAAGESVHANRIHSSYEYGILAMDIFKFD